MERPRASDFDPKVLDLFDRYVHGMISRREFLDGAGRFAIGGLTAAARRWPRTTRGSCAP
jgi:carboxymethylenebutenolidase